MTLSLAQRPVTPPVVRWFLPFCNEDLGKRRLA